MQKLVHIMQMRIRNVIELIRVGSVLPRYENAFSFSLSLSRLFRSPLFFHSLFFRCCSCSYRMATGQREREAADEGDTRNWWPILVTTILERPTSEITLPQLPKC